MSSSKRIWVGRIRRGKDETGRDLYHWVGRFDTKRERDAAVALARVERPWEKKASSEMTGKRMFPRRISSVRLNFAGMQA